MYTNISLNGYYTAPPPSSQYVARCHLKLEAMHESKPMRGQTKKYWVPSIFLTQLPLLTIPLIYTGTSLIDRSVKGQYITTWSYLPTPPFGQDMTQGQIFKRSLTGLNSQFFFSSTSCLTKAEEPSLSYYLPIAVGGENNWISTFPTGISAMRNPISLVQDWNSCRRVHFLWR